MFYIIAQRDRMTAMKKDRILKELRRTTEANDDPAGQK
jgi:hypothetical protein